MTYTIVVADNERRIREFCRYEMESAGYRVLLAEDGEDAVDIIDARPVDLVVLDEHMPRCGGLEAARRIRFGHPRIPIILFTGDSDFTDFTSPLIDLAVIKSGNIAALTTAIADLLATNLLDPAASELVPVRLPTAQMACSD